jgi:membrane-bound ClpP family serine protease
MVDALMQHRGRIRVFIPYKAYSAGTLLALTGHEIYMSPYAHLTPIDTQVVMGESDVFNLSIPVGVLMQLKNFQMDPKALACQVQTYKYRQEYYADHRMMQVIFKHRYTHHQQQAIMKWLHLI